MLAITRTALAASAIMAGVIVGYALAADPDVTAAEVVAARFPQAGEMLQPLGILKFTPARETTIEVSAAQKGERLAPADACAKQQWPYLDGDCLISASGAAVRRARMVTIERRLGQSASELSRVPVAIVASR